MSRYAREHPEDHEDRMEAWINRADSAEPWLPVPLAEKPELTVEVRCRCGFPFAHGELFCVMCGQSRP